MNTIDFKKNHWYMINQYGFSYYIKCKVVEIDGEVLIVKFYWGDFLFRSRHVINSRDVIRECRKPSLFSNY